MRVPSGRKDDLVPETTGRGGGNAAEVVSWGIVLVILALLLTGVVKFCSWVMEPGKQELLMEEVRYECISHGHREECWAGQADYYYHCVIRQRKHEAVCAKNVRQRVRGWIQGKALEAEARRLSAED